MKKIINHAARILLLVVMFFLIHKISFSQTKEFAGKNISQGYANRLGKYLKKYSVYSLNLKEIAEYVKNNAQKAQLILNLSEKFKLNIQLNDMRSPNFRAVAMTGQGPKELPQTFADTYKGFEDNNHNNIVRLNINASTFEGYIKIGDRWLYVDKLNRYIPAEADDKVVVYNVADVIPDETKKCGSEIIQSQKKIFKPNTNYQESTLTGNCHFLEIATEADFEYYQAFLGSADLAFQRIRDILNLVEGLYTPSYNIKFILAYQQIWTIGADPYDGDSLEVILPQFKNWWNDNRSSVSRDETQLFSGRNILNNHIGLAYIGTVCDDQQYYSSVVNLSPVSNSTVALSAHEMGHNFGANHDATCNGNNIMCSFNQSGTPMWSSQSLTEIQNYIDNSGGCMTESIPTDLIYTGDGSNINYLKLIATNNISINTSAGPVILYTLGYGHLEAGGSIVLKPTNPNSVGFVAPERSTLLITISDVTGTCDPLAARASDIISKSAVKTDYLASQANTVQVLPNPFSSFFNVTINLQKDEATSFIIYNSLGVKVKEKAAMSLSRGINKVSFDCPDFPRGVYMLEINFGNSKTVKKIVKI